jgi:hypothetical protein
MKKITIDNGKKAHHWSHFLRGPELDTETPEGKPIIVDLGDVITLLESAVNSACVCAPGGRKEHDPDACSACRVWHFMNNEKRWKIIRTKAVLKYGN